MFLVEPVGAVLAGEVAAAAGEEIVVDADLQGESDAITLSLNWRASVTM
jgi:hypothetical protein